MSPEAKALAERRGRALAGWLDEINISTRGFSTLALMHKLNELGVFNPRRIPKQISQKGYILEVAHRASKRFDVFNDHGGYHISRRPSEGSR